MNRYVMHYRNAIFAAAVTAAIAALVAAGCGSSGTGPLAGQGLSSTTGGTFTTGGGPTPTTGGATGSMTGSTSAGTTGTTGTTGATTGGVMMSSGGSTSTTSSTGSTGGTPAAVTIAAIANPSNPTGFSFASPVTVKSGTTVTWSNRSGAAHSIVWDSRTPGTSPAPGPNLSLFDGGATSMAWVARTVTTPTTYAYHCGPHGPMMSGVIIVTP